MKRMQETVPSEEPEWGKWSNCNYRQCEREACISNQEGMSIWDKCSCYTDKKTDYHITQINIYIFDNVCNSWKNRSDDSWFRKQLHHYFVFSLFFPKQKGDESLFLSFWQRIPSYSRKGHKIGKTQKWINKKLRKVIVISKSRGNGQPRKQFC